MDSIKNTVAAWVNEGLDPDKIVELVNSTIDGIRKDEENKRKKEEEKIKEWLDDLADDREDLVYSIINYIKTLTRFDEQKPTTKEISEFAEVAKELIRFSVEVPYLNITQEDIDDAKKGQPEDVNKDIEIIKNFFKEIGLE